MKRTIVAVVCGLCLLCTACGAKTPPTAGAGNPTPSGTHTAAPLSSVGRHGSVVVGSSYYYTKPAYNAATDTHTTEIWQANIQEATHKKIAEYPGEQVLLYTDAAASRLYIHRGAEIQTGQNGQVTLLGQV